MQMKVENRLVAFLAVGLQQGQSGWIEGILHRLSHPLRRAHGSRRFVRRQIKQRLGVTLDGHQSMARIDLPEIHEGQGLLILIHLGSRDFAGDQATEDALAGWGSIDEFGHVRRSRKRPA